MDDAPFGSQDLVAINVGNTRTQIGQFTDGVLRQRERFANADLADIVARVAGWWEPIAERPRAALALASVDDAVALRIASAVEDQLSARVFRVGADVPVPVPVCLEPETITGIDRLLNATAAFAVVKQACVVVDAGTAVTIDFIDGEGTFHGGAIAPGAAMQLRALHEGTSALPEVAFARPDDAEPYGRSTAQAMLNGVHHGIRGLVWRMVERYAESYGAFPMVIATGGDAETLFADDELVNRVVPGLTLMGIAASVARALAAAGDADADVSR